MDHTNAKIGNFMDPESVKARTEVNTAKKPQTATVVADQKPARPLFAKKKKTRSKIAGFFDQNDVRTNFANKHSVKSKASVVSVMAHPNSL